MNIPTGLFTTIFCSSCRATDFKSPKLWNCQSGRYWWGIRCGITKPDQMFHILVQACLTEKQFKSLAEKQLFLCCVSLSKASIDVVWLPQASIDEFFRPQKCETFGRELTQHPNRPFPNFKASNSVDQRFRAFPDPDIEGLKSRKYRLGMLDMPWTKIYVVQKRQSTAFEELVMWNGLSGYETPRKRMRMSFSERKESFSPPTWCNLSMAVARWHLPHQMFSHIHHFRQKKHDKQLFMYFRFVNRRSLGL